MRPLLAAAAAALLLAAGACGGGGSSPTSTATCGRIDPPPGSLIILPRTPDHPDDPGLCRVAQRATNVVVTNNDPEVAKRLVEFAPDIRVWQERQLQYAPRVCATCPDTVLDLADIQAQHPEWVLHDASDQAVRNGTGTLLDFGDPEYQAAWAQNMADSLKQAPWTGVVVVADNSEPWVSPPIDPRTDEPMTDDNRADYLAQALALVRGALKTQGWSLVAHNPPITDPDESQIGSTDAVLALHGFAGATTGAWTSLFTYLQVAVQRDVGVWITDDPAAVRSAAVFGYASFLLVADGPYSAYFPAAIDDPLYRISIGKPMEDPHEVDGAFIRTFDQGAVAVNPGSAPVTADLGSYGSFTLAPDGAVIVTPDRTYR
jgi:hypothetical protein